MPQQKKDDVKPLKPKELKKLDKFLEGRFSLAAAFKPIPQATFAVTMDNDYLTANGMVKKKQHLEADFTRRLEHPLSSYAAGFSYTWNRVEFSQQDLKRTVEQMPWTFAQGQVFSFCKTYVTECFSPEKDDIQWRNDYSVGNWYKDLMNLPAVNLLVMMTWDVVFFEGFNCMLVGEDISRIGDVGTVSMFNDSYVHMDFKGCSTENSFFKNGRMGVKCIGLSRVNERPVVVYEYRSAGRLNVEQASRDLSQNGESYFLGKVCLDLQDGDITDGDMTELLTVAVTNKKGKIVPLQKRRHVTFKRLD